MIEKEDFSKKILGLLGAFIVLVVLSTTIAAAGIGTNDNNIPLTDPQLLMGSILPQVSETGKIYLSTDGLGTNNPNGGIIQVEKPVGATVRKAYLAAATTGLTGYKLAAGDIKIDGVGISSWDIETPSSISSYNYWKDVTSMVEGKINGAPAGLVDFSITEVNTGLIDGEILTVIFDDPAQTTDNTIILLFGAQNVLGDTFNIGLANPINKAISNVLDMSLGISYGYQPSGQYSQVDVNGQRMTTSAGGQDDGAPENGALLTVGGIGDVNTNPSNPLATDLNCGSAPRCDDELYNLLPFVNTGDTNIKVDTQNPSQNDNIFFAALNLKGVTAVVNQGITLSPPDAKNPVGTSHTVTAKVQDGSGNPVVGKLVTFTVLSGPNVGLTGTATTGVDGKAIFTYTSNGNPGTDMIQASFLDGTGKQINSNKVVKIWETTCPGPNCNQVPEFPTVALPIMSVLGIMFLMSRKKHN